jgi:hypothetical protein
MSIYAERARYVPVERGFNIKRPSIEPTAFVAEMERAFAADAMRGFISLDQSQTLGTPYPAMTPFMLARYVRIRQGETLACALAPASARAGWVSAGQTGRRTRQIARAFCSLASRSRGQHLASPCSNTPDASG